MHLRWLRTVRTISLNDSTVAGLEQLTRGFGKHCPETDYLRENGFLLLKKLIICAFLVSFRVFVPSLSWKTIILV